MLLWKECRLFGVEERKCIYKILKVYRDLILESFEFRGKMFRRCLIGNKEVRFLDGMR